jgi:Flp pilus assembly pilin Flp
MAQRWLADQRGGSSTEYLVVVCLVAVAAVGTWRVFGEHIACRLLQVDAQFAELLSDDRDGELVGQCARLDDAPESSFSTATPSTATNAFVISSPDSVANGDRLASAAASIARAEFEPSPAAGARANSPPPAAGTNSESFLTRRVGTAGKAIAVAAGAVAGAALAAGGSWASAAVVAACGPAAPLCAGAIAGVVAYQSVQYVKNGGLRELARSFSGVFSSNQSTIREALQVGTTLGGVFYGIGASGGLGSRIATETQEIALAGARTGTALRGRVAGALGSETAGTASSPAVAGAVCFRAGTLVHTAEGPEPIERVAPGAWVWARGEKEPRASLRRVVGRFVTPDQPVLSLVLVDERGGSDTLEVTAEHPFYATRGAWTPARSLRPGDRVRSMSGELTVTALRAGEERVTVYNIEVEVAHTYFVGSQAAWVHNTCQAPKASGASDDIAAGYMRRVETLDVGTPRNGAVFYSGRGQRLLAEEFAATNGRSTLEMTPGGRWLDERGLFGPNSPLTQEQATAVWSRLSERFAQEASGNAVGFVQGARPQGIFNKVEFPALLKNPNIKNVITRGY